LIQEDGLEFTQLVKATKKSPSTVSLYLSQIVEDRLVEIKFIRLKKRYYIKVRDLIDKLIEDYRPSLLEKPASGFEDILNSF
ncbi:MAG: ArsR family transcriptional regulator, partial [Nitrosopumilus sp.]